MEGLEIGLNAGPTPRVGPCNRQCNRYLHWVLGSSRLLPSPPDSLPVSKLLTLIRDLSRRKAREKRGLVLAEGVRLVEEALAAGVAFTGVAVAPALEGTDRGRALKAQLVTRGV